MVPTISIVTPVYNAEAFLAETISSVIRQSRGDWEWILIDDGSSDHSREIVQAVSDQRIRLVSSQHLGNPSVLRNRGARMARGRYLVFLDHDDVWQEEFLAATVDFLETRQGVAVVQANSDSLVEGPLGWSHHARMVRMPSVIDEISGGVEIAREMLAGNFVVPSATVVCRDAFEMVGGFDESLEVWACTDFDLWLKLIESGVLFGFVNVPLASYRHRALSMSSARVRHISNRLHVFERLPRRAPRFYAGLRREIRAELARWRLEKGVQKCAIGEAGWRRDILRGFCSGPRTARALKWTALTLLPTRMIQRTLSWRNKSSTA